MTSHALEATQTGPVNCEPAQPPALLTVEEVASILGCRPRMVRQLYWTGQLAAVKVSTLVRFERAEIDRYIESRRRPRAG